MLSGRGITGAPPPSGVCGMGAIKVGMGLIFGPEDDSRKTAGVGQVSGGGVRQIVGSIARHAGRLSRGCVAGGAVAVAGAAHHLRNHAADGEADGEQDGQREPEKGARHALGRLGFDSARCQREDGGERGAGGEGEAGEGMMVQHHRADAGLQGDGYGKSGAEFANEAALGELDGGEQLVSCGVSSGGCLTRHWM